MKPLPQRRKSAEEIAKLRESLGVPPVSGEVDGGKSEIPRQEPIAVTPPQPAERVGGGGQEARATVPEGSGRDARATVTGEPAVIVLKPSRSLRRSEQIATPRRRAEPASSKLPARRHSEQEIMERRRREMAPVQSPAEKLRQLTAHPVAIGAGYSVAVAAAVCAWQLYSPIPAACLTAAALGFAAWLGIRKVRSRHHAAFIFLIALFTGVFGGLHHFSPKVAEAPPPADAGDLSKLLSADQGPSSLTDEERAMILDLSQPTRESPVARYGQPEEAPAEVDPPAEKPPAEDPDAP